MGLVAGKRGSARQPVVDAAYQAAVGGRWCSDSEFWQMHPRAFWMLFDRMRPRRVYGSGRGAMTEGELRVLYDKTYGPNGAGY